MDIDSIGSLIRLREGTDDRPLFLFSGGDGDPLALAPLASRMRNFKALIGVDFCCRDDRGQLPSSVETMAIHSCSAIRALQPHGPYHLVGYSFGGLVAIEVARLLRDSGAEIALLGMVDTLFDQRFWPVRIFLRSQALLIRRHLATLVRLPPDQMARTLLSRTQRLFLRFARRQIPSSLTVRTSTADATTSVEQHCVAAMGNYRPRYYASKITFFRAENHDDYGCDPTELWRALTAEIEYLTICGNHIDIVADAASLTELAAALDSRLATDRGSA